MRRYRSFNHSTCKTVLNLLEAVYLRLRKIVVERVTVVKFRVDNREFGIGIHGFALNWFKSYLTSRSFRVKCDKDFSSEHFLPVVFLEALFSVQSWNRVTGHRVIGSVIMSGSGRVPGQSYFRTDPVS